MKKIFLETTYTNLHLHVPFADATPLSPPPLKHRAVIMKQI